MRWFDFFNNLKEKKKKKKIVKIEDLDISERIEYVSKLKSYKSLEKNIDLIKTLLGKSIDLNIRRFVSGKDNHRGALIFLSGLTDTRSIEEILDAVEVDLLQYQNLNEKKENILEIVSEKVLNNKQITITTDINKVLDDLTIGSSIILFDGINKIILCETRGFQVRNTQEPESEMSLRGPRDGFIENIFVNTSLIRQRIRVPHLWFEGMEIGSLSKTQISIAYIKGLASEELVEEVRERLKKVDIDNVLDSGYIQEYIKDQPFTIFPLVERTERPDKVVSCLVEGKVAILVNGTPFVLIVPTTYNMLLQAPDDYYAPFPIGSFIRILRHASFLISSLLPGIYISVINFHQELLPITLLTSIAASREGIPFPVVVESLLMEGLFEILREAGLRLPKSIGSAISIVGALVLGEAAINAGLVSPPMVIIVAVTAISSFTNPSYELATAARILRFIFIILGSTLGMFGIQFVFLMILVHFCSLRSFGQPYFQPFGPLIWSDLKDSVIRLFIWKQSTRPKLIGSNEPQRQKKGQKPEPPEEN